MINRVITRTLTGIAAILMAGALSGCVDDLTDLGSASEAKAFSGSKTASLSWNAPATRINGEGLAMGELKGYIILYGQDPSKLDRRVEIIEASTMDYTVANLTNGEWYFAIQVVDTYGLASAPSQVVSKVI
ncbi:fibronectin type III domain-containing protein [Marinobacter salicampi]|uniref:fibronectin type III domain-containing protein n=1 Tax=Marinobacter salicampi TaxID=435907 RepID=UPI001F5FBE9A|nr:fibronectin type III domain-containing protein [Marinobacter salicampi]